MLTGTLDGLAQSNSRFTALFVIGPALFASIIPTLLFGMLLDQWGSNLFWGSVFGFGWCMAAFAFGDLRYPAVGWIGLAWGWAILIPLYIFSGWLWLKLTPKSRRNAVIFLFASFLIDVPAKTLMAWDARGFHLPDYTLHAAESY